MIPLVSRTPATAQRPPSHCVPFPKKTERGYAALLMLRPLNSLFSDSGGVCGRLYWSLERDVRALSSGQPFELHDADLLSLSVAPSYAPVAIGNFVMLRDVLPSLKRGLLRENVAPRAVAMNGFAPCWCRAVPAFLFLPSHAAALTT
jgi:hypothetical protein